MSYILLKYIANKKYLKEFIRGSLYMNPLYNFWNDKEILEAEVKREYMLRNNASINPDSITIPMKLMAPLQGDLLEGTIGFGDDAKIRADFQDHLQANPAFRSVGMSYCNVLCFYKLYFNYDILGSQRIAHYDTNPDMKNLGEYVVIIKDQNQFLNRINMAVEKQGYSYVAGSMRYHEIMNGKSKATLDSRHHVLVKTDKAFDMCEEPFKGKSLIKRDCFDKTKLYESQNEWRVALYRGMKSTEAYRLEVGDLKDIVTWERAENVADGINEVLSQNKEFGLEGYFGNISRRDMREKFYALGDYKANLMAFIG